MKKLFLLAFFGLCIQAYAGEAHPASNTENKAASKDSTATHYMLRKNMPICHDEPGLKKFYNRIMTDGGTTSNEIARNYHCALADKPYKNAIIMERDGHAVRISVYSDFSQHDMHLWTRDDFLISMDEYNAGQWQ